MHCPKASSPQSYASDFSDCIGMESCIDLKTDDDDDDALALSKGCGGSDGGVGERDLRWGMKREKREKHYPPPMPSLARTGNLPWVLKKCYTSDGRLVITEEKVKHHGYFMAHRSNGRLTLHLVPLDDGVLDSHDDNEVFQEEEEEEEEKMNDIVEAQYDKNTNQSDHDDNDENDGGDEGENGGAVVLPEDGGLSIMGDGGGGDNFYNYDSLRSSSCMLGMPVPSIRPVHI